MIEKFIKSGNRTFLLDMLRICRVGYKKIKSQRDGVLKTLIISVRKI